MKSLALALLLGFAVTAPASATYVVDTGTPSGIYNLAYYWGQHFAGEFTLDSDTTITGAEGWFEFDTRSRGSITLTLHGDNGHLPGTALYSASFEIDPIGQDWYGFTSGLDWDLTAGTYWISFNPSNDLYGTMPGGAPSPLSEYAAGASGRWYDSGRDAVDFIAVGVRLSGHATAAEVPEPAAIGLLGLGMLGIGALRRRKAA